jgi:MFS family permease
MPEEEPPQPVRRLLANPAFRRLWGAGVLANSMRWVEILTAGIFTFEVTGSALAVALVSMMRAVPMLLAGALTGAIADCLDRRRLLLAGIAASVLSSGAVALLAATGELGTWHLALAGLVAGLAWTGENATRRRMVGEVAGPRDLVPAIALDTVTNSVTRMAGPLSGGLLYATLGMAAASGIACAGQATAFALVLGVRHRQEARPLRLRRLAAEIGEGIRVARGNPALTGVLGITVVTNIFGFSFSAVLPAFGASAFGASAVEIGLLAAAEPAGALLTGLWLALGRRPPLNAAAMAAGTALFLAMLLATAAAPVLWLALLLLATGGLGTAVFANLQTSLVILLAPAEARSRVLGLTTTSIGTGPAGVLAVGALADAFGPAAAVATMAVTGLVALGLVMRLARAAP